METTSITTTKLAKPFLKWAGGKTQLLPQYQKHYPQALKDGKIKRYVELFLGGGAVFFDVIQQFNIQEAYLNDINPDLILAYRTIKENPEAVITELSQLQTQYHQAFSDKQEKLFYSVRDKFNKTHICYTNYPSTKESIQKTAFLIFLNKTCFNGLYRTNKQGKFNVPWGKYKNPTICNTENILAVSKLLQPVTLRFGDYRSLDHLIDRDSFVYLDPPYRPVSKSASFTSYNQSDFNDSHQKELSDYYTQISTRALVMASNSYQEDLFFHDLYGQFNIETVSAKRSINSNGNRRGQIRELIIKNY